MADPPGALYRRLPQLFAAVTATLGGMSLGTVLGWSSPANEIIKKNLGYSDEQVSWVAGITPIGALVSMIIIGFLLDFLGRKPSMLLLVPPFLAGWMCLAFGKTLWMLILGRFITGLAGAAFCTAAPVYTGEIAEKEIRGTLGVFFQLLLTIGILYSYCFGLVKSLMWLSIACAAIPVVFFLLFLLVPESPAFLLAKGRKDDAQKSLQWLRGAKTDIGGEFNAMQSDVAAAEQRKNAGSIFDLFKSKAVVKALVIGVGLQFCQQLSGINAVIFNAETIFKDAGSKLEPAISAIILAVIQVLATMVAALTVDLAGRRLLLVISHVGMGVCFIALGAFFHIKENDPKTAGNIGWLPLASLCIYLLCFSLGSGPLPWAMIGEIFPGEVKGPASAICGFVNWILAFIISKTFVNLIDAFGQDVTFWLYSVICFIATLFIILFVIETKGKTLDEIQQELGGN